MKSDMPKVCIQQEIDHAFSHALPFFPPARCTHLVSEVKLLGLGLLGVLNID
jgi:hypothetical protein